MASPNETSYTSSTVTAIREEANARMEEYRSREAALIAQIKKTAEERVARAEAERSAALELVAQLQNTSDSNKTVMEQHLKL